MHSLGKKTIFALHLDTERLRLLKIVYRFGHVVENVEVQESLLSQPEDTQKTARLLRRFLSSFGYAREPVFAILPRLAVVSRTLLLPETKAPEIEQMIALQAPRFLPYPFQELSVGFQVVDTPQKGYSLVHCSIIPKKDLARYAAIFSASKVSAYDFFVHSYCVAAYFSMLYPAEKNPNLVIAQVSFDVEILVIWKGKIFESRAFTLDHAHDNEDIFITESVKTLDVYRKDTGCSMPVKTVLLLAQRPSESLVKRLQDSLGLPVEIGEIPENLQGAGVKRSFAAQVGIIGVPQSLSLLPLEHKRLMVRMRQKISMLRLGILLIIILMIGTVSLHQRVQIKKQRLADLKIRIASMLGQDLPDKELEQRLDAFEQYTHRAVPALDFLGGVYAITPQGVSLRTFLFEDTGKVVLKGESHDLGGVLTFVSVLQQHQAFTGYSVKVKYATAKKNADVDSVDFEIICEKNR